MKKVNICIVIVLIALCLVGWYTLTSKKVSKSNLYKEYMKQADEWVEKGLYQRAIKNYELALTEKTSEEIYVKMLAAYQKRYEEAPEETIDDYSDFLKKAVNLYPANKELVDAIVPIYMAEEEYENIYDCLKKAIDNGYDDEEIRQKLSEVQYSFELLASEFVGIRESLGEFYTALKKTGWNIYNLDDGYILPYDYNYVGLCNEDGVTVITGEDSRIVTAEGMVLGIFDGIVTDSGIYSEELLPACIDGKYSYYNEFAEKQFGEYEAASMFQNGIAAVKENEKWKFINNKGETISDDVYEEIVLDSKGRYIVGNTILLKKDGTYCLCDEKFNIKTKLECSDVDVYIEDELIAVCQNEKWGYANSNGEIVIAPEYEEARSFSNGLAAVKNGNKWGFINTNNELVIDYQFTDAGYMDVNGMCIVRTDIPEGISTDGTLGETVDNIEIWKFLKLYVGIKEEKE